MSCRWCKYFNRMIRACLRLVAACAFIVLFTTFAPAQESPQQFEGFDLTGYTESGEKAWDVTGDSADILGDEVHLTNIDANSYGEDPMNLKARTGSMNKATGNMHVQDDVVITTSSGAELLTDSLNWQRNNDLVTTEDEVLLTKENVRAEGKGAKAHPNLNAAQINEDVTVTMDTQSEEGERQKVVITCDGPMELDYQNQYAVFHKNVVAVESDRELHADKMEVYFDQDSDQVTQMICTGNVVIIQGQNKSFADKATYTAATQKLVLSGRPKLIMIPDKEGESPMGF